MVCVWVSEGENFQKNLGTQLGAISKGHYTAS